MQHDSFRRRPYPTSDLSKPIPRILHTIWPGSDPFRAEFHGWRQSWMKYHPDWTFLFWRFAPDDEEMTGDEAVDGLLRDPHYSPVLKSDVLRLLALAHYGGIYADTDFECLRSFEELLSVPHRFFCAREPEPCQGLFSPALMGATPAHPFVVAYLDRAKAAVASTPIAHCNNHPEYVTGPWLMGKVIEGRADVTILASELLYPKLPPRWFSPEKVPDHQRRVAAVRPFAQHHWNSAGKGGYVAYDGSPVLRT